MSYNSEKTNIVLDVNVWIDAIEDLGSLNDWKELVNLKPNGLRATAMNSVKSLVKGQLSNKGLVVSVNSSDHILNLVRKRLVNSKKWDPVNANIAVAEISKFCLASDGNPAVNWKPVLNDVKATINYEINKNDNYADSINTEDIIVLATAVAVNSKILVSNDGGLELMRGITKDAYDLEIVFPRLLSLYAK
jgi:predicted nucleic acid-binding protein